MSTNLLIFVLITSLLVVNFNLATKAAEINPQTNNNTLLPHGFSTVAAVPSQNATTTISTARTLINSTNNITPNTPTKSTVIQSSTTASKGSDDKLIQQHMGREHVIITDEDSTHINNHNNRSLLSPKPEINKVVLTTTTTTASIVAGNNSAAVNTIESLSAFPEQQDGDKKSVPKKGVNFSDMDPPLPPPSNASSLDKKTPPVVMTVVKKPLITEAGEDAPYAPSNFDVPKKLSNASIEYYVRGRQNHPRNDNYIVPIISVIFSVPLVAILISVLYNRGSEWWQHRHYRRMDFLIEGMYNN